MGFWNFMRDMFLFDWLFGHRHNGVEPTKYTNYSSYDRDCNCDHDCDCDLDYDSPRSSCYTHNSWDDGNYSCDDYYHDPHDDYAHDYDDFDDNY